MNHALSYSYHRNAYGGSLTSYVAHITLVKGVPFYGYHVGYRYFLKIYLRNPAHMTRFADLLATGAIMNRSIQSYEAHMQYLLQWMCDYNLYGCAVIACSKVSFRLPIPSFESAQSQGHKWHDQSIRPEDVLDRIDYQRQTHCTIEVDIQLQDVLNRHEVQPRSLHHNFAERLLSTDGTEKYVPSMAGLWKDETIRRRRNRGMKESDGTPFPAEALVTMSADVRATKDNWVHEETYMELIQQIVAEEQKAGYTDVSFEAFDQKCAESTAIKTVIQSVADLYPENIKSKSFCLVSPAVDDNAAFPTSTYIEPIIDKSHIPKIATGDAPAYYSDDEFDDDGFDIEEAPITEDTKDNVHAAPAVDLSLDKDHDPFSQSQLPPTPTPKKAMQTNGIGVPTPVSGISFVVDGKHFMTPSRPNAGITSGASKSSHFDSLLKQSASIQGRKPIYQSAYETNGNSSAGLIPVSNLKQSLTGTTKLPTSSKVSFADVTKVAPDSAMLAHDIPPEEKDGSSRRQKDLYAANKKMFNLLPDSTLMILEKRPPSARDVPQLLDESNRPAMIHQDAHYSSEYDIEKQVAVAKRIDFHSCKVSTFPDFTRKVKSLDAEQSSMESPNQPARPNAIPEDCSYRVWRIAQPPPTRSQVLKWASKRKVIDKANARARLLATQRLPATAKTRKNGIVKRPLNPKPSGIIETQYMSVMSLEVHTRSRGSLAPDPLEDEIRCIVWSIQSETTSSEDDLNNGIIMFAPDQETAERYQSLVETPIDFEDTELELINRLVDVVRDLDPDILVGYEVHNGSWGYLIERSRLKYEFDLCNDLSRVNFGSRGRFGKEADRWGFTHSSTIRITGRHMMNIWRAMRGEMNLLQYTIENVAFRLLRIRVPHYSFKTLCAWYDSGILRDVGKVLDYFLYRTQLNLKILQGVDMVAKTSEQARLLGVDFFSVISRGSQFKVESLMFRIAKPENYILISPSRKQVGQQNALECLPLVMEPQSNFYPSPVLVLDFQSLYPSIMIAYNYCYSTCLGRIANWRGRNKLGVIDYNRQPGIMELLNDDLSIAPNGLVYVRPNIRKSLLAKMLSEILETRVMVKSGMKQDKKDKILQRLMNNRQLALKLIANVTYGYTSASFSGRMPCAEIADSIVQSGRETLEKAIAIIHSVERWGAEVVYGDTDSLFVHLKGRSKDEAFKIGKEIAEAITKVNPRPIKLKFEKVYHPCVLLAKKRYVGFKYEHPDQVVPEFDAKGIETVRRDGTPIEQRIEERALRILFKTQDLSKVREYFQKECLKIMTGQINIQDFLFAKEVKLGTYSDKGPGPPGALIATKKMQDDRRLEPQYGERVPYIVVAGAPGARLIDRCVDPDVLLNDEQSELDAEYYISKNLVPPLERIFTLVGANVRGWYDEMPKIQRLRTLTNIDSSLLTQEYDEQAAAAKRTLETYMREKACLICSTTFIEYEHEEDSGMSSNDEESHRPSSESDESTTDTSYGSYPRRPRNHDHALKGLVCDECASNSNVSMYTLQRQLTTLEARVQKIHKVCRNCSGLAAGEIVTCDSKDCPIFYTRVKDTNMMHSMSHTVRLLTRRLTNVKGKHSLEF